MFFQGLFFNLNIMIVCTFSRFTTCQPYWTKRKKVSVYSLFARVYFQFFFIIEILRFSFLRLWMFKKKKQTTARTYQIRCCIQPSPFINTVTWHTPTQLTWRSLSARGLRVISQSTSVAGRRYVIPTRCLLNPDANLSANHIPVLYYSIS